jgi:hypothetical protein
VPHRQRGRQQLVGLGRPVHRPERLPPAVHPLAGVGERRPDRGQGPGVPGQRVHVALDHRDRCRIHIHHTDEQPARFTVR